MPGALAISGTGLVTSVGLSAPATCAAIRAKLANPTETHFLSAAGEFILAHEAPIDRPSRGRARLGGMAVMAIEEAMANLPRPDWSGLPLLLCVAEHDRPGREEGLDDLLFGEIEASLGVTFADSSEVIAAGRASVGLALERARLLMDAGDHSGVLIVATDSLLTGETLDALQRAGRLLSEEQSDGFMPGEAAGAVFVSRPLPGSRLLCLGIGRAVEPAPLGSGEPLRAEGLTRAVTAAMTDAGVRIEDMDLRLADLSGEQYYFKEASLMVTRVLRRRKAEFDLWHPAESVGEAGAAIGAVMVAVAEAACRKGYAPGPSILAHVTNDSGTRVAFVLGRRTV
jgi:3-oxoacyl-[acyl-carrier-protein] synthase-1